MTLAALIDEQDLLTVLKRCPLVHCSERWEAGLSRGWPVRDGRRLRSPVDRLRFALDRLRFALDRLRFALDRLRFALDRLRTAINRSSAPGRGSRLAVNRGTRASDLP
jgi:hypothetical protein